MTSQRTLVRAPAEKGKPINRRRRPSPTVVAIAVLFLLGAIAAVVTVSTDRTTKRETAPVEITGVALPEDGGTPDAAVGLKAPEAQGVDFDGRPVAITNDGRAKAIVFLAHWCPHCQREVPKVVRWIHETGGVGGVDIYAVSTMASPSRPNWPPSAWLDDADWPVPVLVDDKTSSLTKAFGLSGTPLWIFVKEDGTVGGRAAGEVPLNTLEAAMRSLLVGAP